MGTHRLYYATNRNHIGRNRWRPDSYGKKFSDDGVENLRFGRVFVDADEAKIKKCLTAEVGSLGTGKGDDLADYMKSRVPSGRIEAYREVLRRDIADRFQKNAKLGSASAFSDLRGDMLKETDVLVFLHGFNVSWEEAVGSALALQLMLSHSKDANPDQQVLVFLFTWPSDGQALPFVSYLSDRSEAAGSGKAFGRGLLKVRDFLCSLRDKAKGGSRPCEQDIHLLCHSMGNYLLQHTVQRIDQFTPGNALPRLFEHIFLCAADVDDDVLEPDQSLGRLHQLARNVSIYHNRGDVALVVSDYSKGNPDRLGSAGAARPKLLHNKVHQIDCSPIVPGLVEHSYYLSGHVNADIRQSIDGVPLSDSQRRRSNVGDAANQWVMNSSS
jgi:esterase/lipase superfamily enzyme